MSGGHLFSTDRNRVEMAAMCKMMEDMRNEAELNKAKKLDEARMEIWNYLPEGFDPEQELEEARKERYGSID